MNMNVFNTNNLLAKLVVLILIIIASSYHLLFGILLLILFLGLSNSNKEGMTNPSKDDISEFRKQYCKNGNLMKDNKIVTPENIKDSFPNIKFSNESCNPCDEECSFEIISSSEQMTTQNNLKPIDSNTIPVNRTESIKKK